VRPRDWRAALAIAALVVAAVPPVLAVTTSSAAEIDDDVEFSTDGGATWSPTAPASLFPAGFLVVPGDSLESSLLVRSTRTEPTVAMVAITNASTDDSLFAGALTVQGQDDAGDGLPATPIAALAPCDAVVPTRVLETGEALPVTLVVSVSSSLRMSQAEDAVANFDLAIALADPGVPVAANGCPIDPTVIAGFAPTAPASGTIAYTGAALVYPTLAVAASALAAGSLFVVAGRRRRRRSEDRP
jgi:hypothetical protein